MIGFFHLTFISGWPALKKKNCQCLYATPAQRDSEQFMYLTYTSEVKIQNKQDGKF